MKIFLLGYMASGKSSVGKYLSEIIKLPFIDLDKYIEEKEQNSITNIFNNKGEIYFRLKEHNYLKELISNDNDFIVSLGGGTPCYSNNMELLINNKNIISIYLQASIKTLVNRLLKSKQKRPLVSDLKDDKLTEFIAKHLFERKFFYEKASVKINVDNQPTIQVAQTIQSLISFS